MRRRITCKFQLLTQEITEYATVWLIEQYQKPGDNSVGPSVFVVMPSDMGLGMVPAGPSHGTGLVGKPVTFVSPFAARAVDAVFNASTEFPAVTTTDLY